ncbi:WbqC family protein [uncultured Thiodictyon sp.]|jgi:hypothetical protein|uniref:WbqC family protein n=1 Tax=uncultured Thiodictyon sp. TaxID=1846217 RepID=UPI0025FB18DA|nr:WbqC family protein [uncultured Thiodictyon sp.]
MKKVAILQSNYIPWKGYFDLIAAVDEFILYDDMQYTRRDWRNRNKIKTPLGLQWLTVPVKVKGKYHQTIKETENDGSDWQESHWKSLVANYRRSAHFEELSSALSPFYLERSYLHLSTLNRTLIDWVCGYLGIATRITTSSDYRLVDGKTERLLDLCLQTGATEYISGPAARGYLDETLFADAGIAVNFFDYGGYPSYPQLWGTFEHGVSILDLLFNCGADSPRYLHYVSP